MEKSGDETTSIMISKREQLPLDNMGNVYRVPVKEDFSNRVRGKSHTARTMKISFPMLFVKDSVKVGCRMKRLECRQ